MIFVKVFFQSFFLFFFFVPVVSFLKNNYILTNTKQLATKVKTMLYTIAFQISQYFCHLLRTIGKKSKMFI